MKTNQYFWPIVLVLLSISALAYLPMIANLGFYKDDWYLIYDARSQGASFFTEVYRIDRPARAYVLQFLYSLFGDRLLFYHLTAYIFRLGAAAALAWSLLKTWPRQVAASLVASLLFLLYPGFLSQINPIDYQAQLLSLCLALLSIALTVQAIQTENISSRFFYSGLSILLGLAYLPLVEYFIGFEALRLAFIVQFVLNRINPTFSPRNQNYSIKSWFMPVLRLWLPFLIIPIIFLTWRLFFFETERRATNFSIQIGQIFSSLQTSLGSLLSLAEDSVKAIFLAWTVPFYNLAFDLRLRYMLPGLGISALAAGLALIGLWYLARNPIPARPDQKEPDWRMQFLVVGLIMVLAGLLPVILVNRRANFDDYSRYLLASAAGSAMIVTGLIYLLESKSIRTVLIAFLVLSSTLTHFSNAAKATLETRNILDFWWQVSWRVPDIEKGTTLVAEYPIGAIQEDYFVWGPANLIYQPEKQNQIPIEIKIPAAVLTDDTVLQILRGKGNETQLRRGNNVVRDFGNILVLAQSSSSSCVRVIDGNYPELSETDKQRILLVAPGSNLRNVLATAEPQTPATNLFGAEPAHGWCYYYQKAALARQLGDWKKVATLGEKAISDGFYPSDKIEWIPFMQAYTVLGQKEKLHRFVSIMGESPFIQKQACNILSASATDSDMLTSIQTSFCK